MTTFKLDTRKAIEAAATILRHVPHRTMSRKRLLALLYIADRECLKQTGRPIIGGRLAALPYGPIHSEVYDLIKGGYADQAEWSKHFQNERYLVRLADEPSIAGLSRFEIGILDQVSRANEGEDTWDIAKRTHRFAEYEKNYCEGTSSFIPLEDLVEAVGRTDKETVVQDAMEKNYFDKLFASDK